jgi:hypothetical protein
MKKIVAIVSLLVAMAANAGDRQETIKQIMEAQGLVKMFEQQLELGRKQSREQGRAMLDQMMSSLNPSPEFTKRFEEAFQSFMSEVETPWEAPKIVEVWAKYYGEHFTDQELEQLLAHYRTPLAQKEVAASRQALIGFSNHFAEAGKPIAEKAISNFITNLRLIAKECNCRR